MKDRRSELRAADFPRRCLYTSSGCRFVGNRANVFEHEIYCDFIPRSVLIETVHHLKTQLAVTNQQLENCQADVRRVKSLLHDILNTCYTEEDDRVVAAYLQTYDRVLRYLTDGYSVRVEHILLGPISPSLLELDDEVGIMSSLRQDVFGVHKEVGASLRYFVGLGLAKKFGTVSLLVGKTCNALPNIGLSFLLLHPDDPSLNRTHVLPSSGWEDLPPVTTPNMGSCVVKVIQHDWIAKSDLVKYIKNGKVAMGIL